MDTLNAPICKTVKTETEHIIPLKVISSTIYAFALRIRNKRFFIKFWSRFWLLPTLDYNAQTNYIGYDSCQGDVYTI